jgi:hypothetical protein
MVIIVPNIASAKWATVVEQFIIKKNAPYSLLVFSRVLNDLDYKVGKISDLPSHHRYRVTKQFTHYLITIGPLCELIAYKMGVVTRRRYISHTGSKYLEDYYNI